MSKGEDGFRMVVFDLHTGLPRRRSRCSADCPPWRACMPTRRPERSRRGDVLVYEFFDMGVPQSSGDLPMAPASPTPARWATSTS